MSKNKRSYRKGNARNTKSIVNGRKISKYEQAAIRRQAIRLLFERNLHPEAVAQGLGISVRSVYRWIKWFKKRGWEAFPPPKPCRKSKLTEPQLSEIFSIILTKTPLDFKFDTVLWTREIIADLIFQKFSISLHETTIGRILKRNNLTPQKPIRKAYQQDEKEVEYFKNVTFPELMAKAKKEGATILFLDETSAISEPNIGRTWGIRGQTPIVPANGKREKINVIGTISLNGSTDFMGYEGNTDTNVLIAYIDTLAKKIKGKIYIILDNASYHKSEALMEHIQKYHAGWLELVLLPSYSPELNPSELIWAHLKSHGLNRIVTKTKVDFHLAVDIHLKKFMENPSMGMSVFGKKELSFIRENIQEYKEAA